MPASLDVIGSTERTWQNVSEAAHISSTDLDVRSKIQTLEKRILKSRRHYNDISILLSYVRAQHGTSNKDILAAVALGRIFTQLLDSGNMSASVGSSESEILVMKWLNQKNEDFKTALLGMITSLYVDKSTTALNLIMQLIKEDASKRKMKDVTSWRNGLFPELLATLVSGAEISHVRLKFVDEYLKIYDDVRYYSFFHLADFTSTESSQTSISHLMSMMGSLDRVPESPKEIRTFFIPRFESDKDPLLSPRNHKKVAQTFWTAVFRLRLDISQREAVLELIPQRIAPWYLKAELLMDFLTDSFDAGGGTSLKALSGLFYLMQEKSLDYPQFYHKLYSLLTPSTMHSKHRSRFFRLLDTFLASTHLPACLVASFIKRLSRLALYAPPSGIVAVVPWIYNLLRKHPICTFMLHRNPKLHGKMDSITSEEVYKDTFCMEEPDPMNTGALESSLWEIQMLQSHYHPNVATIARIVSEQFKKPSYNLEHFLNHSYGSMLDIELSKTLKRPPEVEHEIPKKIFLQHSPDSSQQDALVTRLWNFS